MQTVQGLVSFYTETNISEASAVQDNKRECQTTYIVDIRPVTVKDTNVGLAGFLSVFEHNLMPNRSNEDELRSVCPLQILNRKDTELFWDQHTGQMADSEQRDVSEWENCSEIRSAHSVSE